MAIHSGTVWPAVRILVSFLLYAIVHVTATLDVQEITTSNVELLRGLALNYQEESHNRDSRESSACNTTESMTVNCNLDCQCVDGKWQCCRLRKEINMMTKAEVKRFSSAYVKVANDPRYSPAFIALSWSHAVLTCDFVMRETGFAYSTTPNRYYTAVSWHNMMIFALENLLRLVDCGVTVPYWDTTKTPGSDLIHTIPDGFGTFGLAKDNYCITDGPFKKGAFKVPKLTYKGKSLPYSDCIQRRDIKPYIPPLPYQLYQTMLTVKPDLAMLLEYTIYQIDDEVFHLDLGGSFLGLTAAVDPLIYLLHNFGNKLVANYQIQGPKHFTADGRWTTDVPLEAFPWFKSKDFLDYFNFPNGVCIRWGASMPRDEAIQMGYYAGLEIPRKDHISLPYKDVRELPIGPTEAQAFQKDFLVQAKKYFPTFTFTEEGPWVNRTAYYPKHKRIPPPGSFSNPRCARVLKIDPEFLDYNVSAPLAQLLR